MCIANFQGLGSMSHLSLGASHYKTMYKFPKFNSGNEIARESVQTNLLDQSSPYNNPQSSSYLKQSIGGLFSAVVRNICGNVKGGKIM